MPTTTHFLDENALIRSLGWLDADRLQACCEAGQLIRSTLGAECPDDDALIAHAAARIVDDGLGRSTMGWTDGLHPTRELLMRVKYAPVAALAGEASVPVQLMAAE